MSDLIQGPVADALDGGKLQITYDGRKEGYFVGKKNIFTYCDVLVGLDNFSADC